MRIVVAIIFVMLLLTINAKGAFSTRAILNRAIHGEIVIYCNEKGIRITEEHISDIMEIMGSDYNIDDDVVSYDIVVR